jgi:GTPase
MNDIALVRLRFMHAAEFIKKDSVLVIREGRSKIFGYITDIINDK